MKTVEPRVGVILAAAGRSQRFGDPTAKKPFVDLAGKAVWLYSAEQFRSHPQVSKIVMVIHNEDRAFIEQEYAGELERLAVTLVEGGQERADSVECGLRAMGHAIKFVAVHDAARPCIDQKMLTDAFTAAMLHGAAAIGIPVTSTLKKVGADGKVSETVDRRGIWMSQTPQVASRAWLVEAFGSRSGEQPTDEAQLLEQAGRDVFMVEGSPLNLKITALPDLKMAEFALKVLSG